MTASVIVGGARTPIGRFGGGLSSLPAVSLGARAIREALARSGVDPADVDYVIMGHVIQAGTGQITARQAAIEAGIPKEVPAITINKVCLSGLNAIALADQLIRAGELDVVVAGGMESMSQAPYLLPKARDGARMGNTELVDSMVHDGLWSTFTDQHMGESSDEVNRDLGITREEQDAWAARSHARAPGGVGVGPHGRGGRPGRDPAAQGRPRGRRARRGHPARHDARVARRAAAGVRRGRHDHRRQRVADLRRRRPPSWSCRRSAPSGWARRRWPRSCRTACRPSGSPTCTRCRRSRSRTR